MFSNRALQITFMVSLLTHGVILSQNPNFSFLPGKEKAEHQVQVRYLKTKAQSMAPAKFNSASAREGLLNLPPKVSIEKTILQPLNAANRERLTSQRQRESLGIGEPGMNKPAFGKPDVIAIKKKIIFPPLDLEKNNNPSYISYYQIVREKIKRCAYQNYTGKETGEVTISFIISDDGYIKEIRLIEDKSSPSPYLREAALRSINDASPFPNFPKELDYPKLSFNLAITFEVE